MPRPRFCTFCTYPAPGHADTSRSPPPQSERFPSLKMCAGCQHARYCSRWCQQSHWSDHIFNCTPRHGHIDTVYLLKQAIHKDEYPEPQTLVDYRFARAFSPDGMLRLYETYSVMFGPGIGILPQTLRRWRKQGRLFEGIFGAFHRPWTHSGYGYHHWLKENPHILDDSYPDYRPSVLRWAYLAAPDEPVMLELSVLSLPDIVRAVLWFCMMLREEPQWTPPFYTAAYIHFGFCACKDRDDELAFGRRWRRVLKRCSFEAIFQAYRKSSLVSLFRSKGEEIEDHGMRDVLNTSPRHLEVKPVWYLKQMSVSPDHMRDLTTSVQARESYGFTDCGGQGYEAKWEEESKLRAMYQLVFQKKAEPLQLHEASVQNNLYNFVGRYVDFGEDASLFARLLYIQPKKEQEGSDSGRWSEYEDEEDGYETWWEDGYGPELQSRQ